MALTTNVDDREIRHSECDCCHAPVVRIRNQVYRDGAPAATYFAECLHDTSSTEVVALHPDRVTFTGRLRQPDQSTTHPHVQLLQDDTQAHPRLNEFLEVVEFVALHDPTITPHLYSC